MRWHRCRRHKLVRGDAHVRDVDRWFMVNEERERDDLSLAVKDAPKGSHRMRCRN